jgi:hypothetical protein
MPVNEFRDGTTITMPSHSYEVEGLGRTCRLYTRIPVDKKQNTFLHLLKVACNALSVVDIDRRSFNRQ